MFFTPLRLWGIGMKAHSSVAYLAICTCVGHNIRSFGYKTSWADLAVNRIQVELKPCSGNSTLSDFRLNKKTPSFCFLSLPEERRLTHQKVIISAPHVWRKTMHMCMCQRQRGWALTAHSRAVLSSACRALTRALTGVFPPPSVPRRRGFPLVGFRQGGQVKWAIPIQGQKRRAHSPCEMAAHFGRSMHSFPHALALSDCQEGITRRKRARREVCLCVHV